MEGLGANEFRMFPPGIGLMRVTIESAIQNSRRVSYEEVSKYLNENTIFSCSPCSCRTDREIMGEGVAIQRKICIQMGHAAEYISSYGSGREITRKKHLRLLKGLKRMA